ncbi:MAG: molybdate ABC transporter permease subunit [Kouleothrix sp.]|jgi:molybdate transport system permease protein|nr:molybdate ABC transporter permease subunit [Kouleothrix sp.]
MADQLLRAAQADQAARALAPQSRRHTWLLVLASLPMLLFLLLPLVALVARSSPAMLLANLAGPSVAQAISLSMRTTATTIGVTVLGGTPVAYLLARRRFRGRAALDTLLDLPMVLPPAVAGIALLIAFGRRGLIGRYLNEASIEIAFTQAAVVLAQLFVAAPFYIKAAIAGFTSVDRELEQAAALDGARALQVFGHITVPLAWPALLGGAVMAWARALGEFGATIIFAGNFPGRTQTMPLAIYIGFEIDLNVSLTLALILLAISFGVLLVVKGLLSRRGAEH